MRYAYHISDITAGKLLVKAIIDGPDHDGSPKSISEAGRVAAKAAIDLVRNDPKFAEAGTLRIILHLTKETHYDNRFPRPDPQASAAPATETAATPANGGK